MIVNNVSDYIKILSEIQKEDSRRLFYRGHSNIKYKLKPNIYREECYYLNVSAL